MPSPALLARAQLLLRPLRRQLSRPAAAAAAAAAPKEAAAASSHSALPACLAPAALSLLQPWAAAPLQGTQGRQSAVAAAWSSSGSSVRCYATGPSDAEAAAAAAAEEGDAPRRRRRGTTESRAVLRRTTESRAAIEDVAVMSKSQLMRRNKPWLAEQCWHHKLPHEGLKEELVQRLLAWQPTEAGKAAAEAAIAAAAAARAALHAAPAVGGDGALTGAISRRTRRPTSAAAAAAVPAGAGPHDQQQRQQQQQSAEPLVRPAAGTVAAAVAADEADEADGEADTADSGAGAAAAAAQAAAEAAAAGHAGMTGWQPPLSAAAAAASSLGLFLTQLRAQPGNAAAVAAARRALEQHGQALVRQAAAGGGSSSSSMARQLADEVAAVSSPASLAALAKACFSREVLDPLLAAALAEAVAGAAPQLGPQEVHGVLRLLVEHRAGGAEAAQGDAAGGGLRALDRAFEVLAEAMIRCSAALQPAQLAEAVALLGVHGYDDALGLFLLAKEAAARLGEFEPRREGSWVVVLLDAIAGMHVADEVMAAELVAAVSARREAYTPPQLAAIDAALRRMGAADGLPVVAAAAAAV